MRMKRLTVLLPLLLLATACGGSDKEQVAQGLSKADYLTKAEAICARLNTEVDKLTFPTSVAAVPGFVEQTLQIAEAATGEIKALEPPAADKADIKAKVLDPLDGQVAVGRAFLDQIKAAVAKNDTAAVGRLIANPPTGSKADLAWMRSYGFKQCVEAANTEG
jgi:hypothetical protein